MDLFCIRKQKGRLYRSEDIIEGLRHEAGGRPVIPDGCISVSDTADLWICCRAEYPVGIDAENSARTVKSTTVKALHPAEQAFLKVIEGVPGEWRSEFLRIWTRKEAYAKFCGKGLSIGMSTFSVIGADGEFSPVIAKKGYPAALAADVPGLSGCTVSLCIPASEAMPAHLEWKTADYEAPFAVSPLEKAAQLLDVRAYSSAELRSRLSDLGYPKEDADEAVQILTDRGYIDDEAYAKAYARRLQDAGKGKLRIQRELQTKGIDRAQSAGLLEELAGSEEGLSQRELALQQAARLFGEPHPLTEKEAGKLARRLFSLGYENSVIYGVLEEYRK